MGIFACSLEEERGHNEVLGKYAARYFPRSEYEVLLNVGDEQNHDVEGMYPDIIARHRVTRTLCIAEIKTATFISATIAREQWLPFSRLADEFHLVVPTDMLDLVNQLLTGIRVDVLVGYAYSAAGYEFRVRDRTVPVS